MVISDTSYMIGGFTIALLTSCHSCGENQKVNEAFRGIAVTSR